MEGYIMRTNQIKARAEELLDNYQEARDVEFNEQFRDMFSIESEIITEDDLQGFLDNFTFPEEYDWAYDQVQSELDDIGDQKYQEYKERDV